MTTERELDEWPEKIRRVRGQKSIKKTYSRRKKSSALCRVVLFLGSLIIALLLSNHLQQRQQNQTHPQIFRENRR